MAERLSNVVVGAEVQPPDAISFLTPGREQDDGYRAALAQLATDVESAQAWQHHVEHYQVGQRAIGQCKRLLATVRQDGPVALLAQRVADDVGDVAIVVDDQHVHSSSLARGSSTTNLAPCGALSSTRTEPPCRSTSDLTIASPRPLPASPRCCASRPR